MYTPERLEEFKKWMLSRNRDPETVEGYAADIRLSYLDADPLNTLRRKNLAPKTLRRKVAALRAWCKFNKDSELLEKIQDLQLPPPQRKIPKTPLSDEQWTSLVEELDTDAAMYLSPAERGALGIICVRGIRVGDVLRMTREELEYAVKSGLLGYEGKRGKRIEVTVKPILSYINLLLQEKDWKRIRDLISTTHKDEKTKQSSASQQLSRCLKKVGEKVGINPKDLYPHKLRRTYAVAYLDAAGGDITKLKEHMQWADISTAAGYVDHSKREELDLIADKMRKR